MAPDPAAPPVVVVVVTCDPGDWFEEVLSTLAAQDYPNLSILVVDAASEEDPTARVAALLPDAFVRRLEHRVGFGQATNDVLDVVEGASHFLLCHDDVALAPDAVRLLVEEAFRSNAGLVTPKVVDWSAPDRLVAVGAGADRFGVVHPLIEPGELDQEQHDGVRDVFVAPSVATLVRADLFAALGGFDAAVPGLGEDLDLSWRVQMAGARIVTAPAARVRHLGATVAGGRSGGGSAEAARQRRLTLEVHRLHTALSCYGPLRLLWMLPLLVLHSLTEAAGLGLTGRTDEAGLALRALAGAFGHPGRILSSRRRNQRHRQVPDRELAHLQTGGSARLRGWARARASDEAPVDPDEAGADGRAEGDVAVGEPVEVRGPSAMLLGPGSWRLTAAAGAVVVVLLMVGSRSLFGSDLPVVGGLPSPAGGVGGWWHSWWSTWRPAGLGQAGPGAPGLGVLALVGSILGGSTGLAEHVVVLAPLVVGPLGAARMVRSWGSPRARVAAGLAYGTVPVPYDALAHGRWSGLVAYALAPWLLAGVGRLAGTIPFAPTTVRDSASRVLGLGLAVAVGASVAPSLVWVSIAVGAGVALGSALAGEPAAGLRSLVVAVAGAVVAAVALLPWSAGVLTNRNATFGVAPGPAQRLGLGQLLHFHTGPIGNGVLGWGLLVAATLPLAIGRGWRLAWAARMWGVVLVCTGLAWAGGRGWIPAPAPEVLLAPAAAALAGLVALGVVAFEMDLPGYRFGWRQLASGVAVVAVGLAAVPVVQAAGNGRWYLPTDDAGSVLPIGGNGGGDYRVLWVGAPSAIPLPTAELSPGVGWATSWDGLPDATDEWSSVPGSSGAVVTADLRLASARLTTRLGHLLAPMAVRYIVVPDHLAPVGSGAPTVAVPAAVVAGLAQQTDLEAAPGGQGYTVYVNPAAAPARAVLAPGTATALAAGVGGERELEQLDLGGARPVLRGGPDGARGVVPAPSTLYVSSTPSWRLHDGGLTVVGRPALEGGQVFDLPAGATTAVLDAPASTADHLGALAEVAAWVVALGQVVVDRRRRHAAGPEAVQPAWFTHEVRRRNRRGRRMTAGMGLSSDELDDEEVWTGG